MWKIGRFSGVLFLVPIGAQALITLFSIPIIISVSGPQGWSSIAAGQAVGGFLAVVCSLGWNVTGPSLAASADVVQGRKLVKLALYTRTVVSLPLLILGLAIAYSIGLPRPDLAFLGVASTLVVSFNMQWFFIGTNTPLLLVLYDSLPRLSVMLIGWLLVLFGANVTVGLAGQIASSIIAVSVVYLKLNVYRDRDRIGFLTICKEILQQGHGLSTQVFPALLSYFPMIAISILAPHTAALYALIDKVHKQLVTGLVPMGNLLVAKILERFNSENSNFTNTVRVGLNRIMILGIISFVGTIIVAGPLISILSHRTMHLDGLLLVLMSLLVALTVVVALFPAGLMAPVNRLRQASVSLLLGSITGIVSVSVFTPLFGAAGTLSGQALGYILAIFLQWITVRRIFGRRRAAASYYRGSSESRV